MKIVINLILVLFCIMPLIAQEGDVIIKMNGHEHRLPFDLKEQIQKKYNLEKQAIIDEFKDETTKFNGVEVTGIELGEQIESIQFTRGKIDVTSTNRFPFFEFEYDPDADSLVYVVLNIPGNKVYLNKEIVYWTIETVIGDWKPSSNIKFEASFNLELTLHVKIVKDDLKISLNPVSANALMKHIHTSDLFTETIAHTINLFQPIAETKSLNSFINDKQTVLDLTEFSGTVVTGESVVEETNALLQSLPLQISMGEMYKSSALKINIDFLHGYYNDNEQFIGNFNQPQNEPQKVNNLQYAGFGYLHWGYFDKIKKDDPTLTRMERLDTLFQRMDYLGWNQFRFEAVWSDIVPPVSSIDPSLSAANITNPDVTNYINLIDNADGWDSLDSLMQLMDLYRPSVLQKPVMVVGCGHINRPPLFDDNGTLRRIAPGTVREKANMNASDYIAVEENVYLYWLSLYVRAVVRRYAEDIYYWQAENELNAARFTESFYDWWRAGSAWGDDSETGFQTQVAATIYNAIKHEEILFHGGSGDFEVVQAFHLFNAAKRLVEWKDYYDVAGLQIYPHVYHAYPVLGFLPGEYVWAARRILKAIGEQDKQVWITETGYAGNTNDPNPEDPLLNVQHYSYERQAQYISEAIMSCAVNGAQAFQWYLPEMSEAVGNQVEMEQINNYNGFYDITGNRKPVYGAARETFDRLNSTINVTLTNNYLTENVGGSFNIKSIINGLPSGDGLYLNTSEEFTISTTNRSLLRPNTADTVDMRQWNSELDKTGLQKSTDFSNPSEPANQKAIFDLSTALQFDMQIGNHDVTNYLPTMGILDPWLGTVSGHRPTKPQAYLFSGSDPQYEVFKDAAYNENFPDNPYYTVHAPEIIGLDSDNIAVFKEWNAVQNIDITYEDSSSTPIELTGDNPQIEAEYFYDITVELSTLEYKKEPWGAAYFLLDAPKYLGSGDKIYKFEDWHIYQSDGQTVDNTRADLNYSGYSGSLSKVDVKLNKSSTVLRPSYQPISQIQNNVIELKSVYDDEQYKADNLYIGPGSDMVLASGFKMYSNHTDEMEYGPTVNMIGTRENPIEIERSTSVANGAGFLDLFYISPGYEPFDSVLCRIENSHFANFQDGGNAEPVITFSFDIITGGGGGSGSVSHSQHALYIRNSSFYNCDHALEIEVLECPGDISIINSTFHDTEITVVAYFVQPGKKVTFYNCIFSETSIDDLYGGFNVEFNNCIFYNVPNASTLITMGSGNSIANPLFIDSSNGDFYLQSASPCIDAGETDLPSVYGDIVTNYDIDGTAPEIGAFCFMQLQDTIKTDLVLQGECRVVDDLIIDNGVELTILPNTRVELNTGAEILVNGRLTAIGKADSMITFTSVHSNPDVSDYWNRIKFNDSANDSSILRYCDINYAKYGSYIYKADISVESCNISDIRYYGIFAYESAVSINDNDIEAIYHAIYLYRANYASAQPLISGNDLHNCSRGIYLVYSSPYIQENEIRDNSYGIYCTNYSSPKLGWIDEAGQNDIHDNDMGVRAVRSAPFLGQDMCSTNGGYNKVEDSDIYQISAASSSTVVAEKNYWGGTPQSADFFEDATSSIDYLPYLYSQPFSQPNPDPSPEEQLYDLANANGEIISSDSSALTETEVMKSFNEKWPLKRKLLFARNLISLNFPQNAEDICNDVLKNYPDSSLAFFALDILWDAGQISKEDFYGFKAYLDSFSIKQKDSEVYEDAVLIRDGFEEEQKLAKAPAQYYLKYQTDAVASQALLNAFFYQLHKEENYPAASQIYGTLRTNYPDSYAAEEAAMHLGIMGDQIHEEQSVELPKAFRLYGNYPNPFNMSTTLKFDLPVRSKVDITIFNLLGQKIRSLKWASLEAGLHEKLWDGNNRHNRPLSSGLYIMQFEAQSLTDVSVSYSKSHKMIIVK